MTKQSAISKILLVLLFTTLCYSSIHATTPRKLLEIKDFRHMLPKFVPIPPSAPSCKTSSGAPPPPSCPDNWPPVPVVAASLPPNAPPPMTADVRRVPELYI